MAFQSRSDSSMISEINVTPMVDVMLVLLIVFMVAAPLLMQTVPVELPKTAPANPVSATRTLSVTIDRQGHVFVERRPVPIADLEATLNSLNRKDGANLLIQADTDVSFGVVARVMAAAQHAGLDKLAIATSPQ